MIVMKYDSQLSEMSHKLYLQFKPIPCQDDDARHDKESQGTWAPPPLISEANPWIFRSPT